MSKIKDSLIAYIGMAAMESAMTRDAKDVYEAPHSLYPAYGSTKRTEKKEPKVKARRKKNKRAKKSRQKNRKR